MLAVSPAPFCYKYIDGVKTTIFSSEMWWNVTLKHQRTLYTIYLFFFFFLSLSKIDVIISFNKNHFKAAACVPLITLISLTTSHPLQTHPEL